MEAQRQQRVLNDPLLEFRYRVEERSPNGQYLLETLIYARNSMLAEVAYRLACQLMPGRYIMLRHGSRVILESRP